MLGKWCEISICGSCWEHLRKLWGKGRLSRAQGEARDGSCRVAVKKLILHVKMGENQFTVKMKEIGRMHHLNIVPLAYYNNRDEKLAIYDFLPMGSLSVISHSGVSRMGARDLVHPLAGAIRISWQHQVDQHPTDWVSAWMRELDGKGQKVDVLQGVTSKYWVVTMNMMSHTRRMFTHLKTRSHPIQNSNHVLSAQVP
ncbi:hypothetical protein SASPL_135515 [Salvia splendens]|uniref:Protein kinase domain-containing protein n=1 Tax=Salvia splendens TaxID=180675 RepID=A0A8X8WY43_SALSN|nr:hypothetical protein SASPL_135515 [Salvia splendens]